MFWLVIDNPVSVNVLIAFAVKVPLNIVEYKTSLLTVSYIIRLVAVAFRTGAI